jgi:type IV pilus assembly protein PilV
MNKTRNPGAPRRSRGVTMIEALVALVILSVGMLGIAGLYVSGIKAGRSALLRTQAVNLASDMADRIRANRRAQDAYDIDSYAGAPAEQGCIGAACTPEELAEDDLARWIAAVQATLPGRPLAEVDVQFVDVAGDAADRYTVSVTWHEAGEEQPSTYTLVVEV